MATSKHYLNLFHIFLSVRLWKCAQEKSKERRSKKIPLVYSMEKVNYQMLFLIDRYHGMWEMNTHEGLLAPLMWFIFLITSQQFYISRRITNIYANRFMIQCVHMTTSQLSPSSYITPTTYIFSFDFYQFTKMTTLQICDVYMHQYMCMYVWRLARM